MKLDSLQTLESQLDDVGVELASGKQQSAKLCEQLRELNGELAGSHARCEALDRNVSENQTSVGQFGTAHRTLSFLNLCDIRYVLCRDKKK